MALAHDRKTSILRPGSPISFPVAANAVIYGGAIVALNSSGYLVPASADATLNVVGVARISVTGGTTNGAVKCEVEQGIAAFDNGDDVDAIAQTNAGALCYASDDHTANLTSSSATRPSIGTIVGMSGSQVLVEIAGMLAGGSPPSGAVIFGDLASPFGAGNSKLLATDPAGAPAALSGAGAFAPIAAALGAATADCDLNGHGLTGGFVGIGTNPATTGNFRAPANTKVLAARNATNDNDIAIIATDGGNDIIIGDTAQSLSLYLSCGASGGVNLRYQTTVRIQIDSTGIGFYGHAPVAQQLLATGAGHTVDDVITALQAVGLLRQS